MTTLILLFESAVGYSLFQIKEWEEIQSDSTEFLKSAYEFSSLSQSVKLIASRQFKTAKEALENIKCISNKEESPELHEFLQANLPLSKKKASSQFVLGVVDKGLAANIKESLNVNVEVGSFIVEISRIIRTHLNKFLKIEKEDVIKAQLGLAHQYSRMKCMFDVNREDKPVIQSIALVDQLDKDINSFCMRIKEWFGWHFPELAKVVPDNAVYTKMVALIENKERLLAEYNSEDSDLKNKIIEIVVEPEIAERVFEAARSSMGSELNEIDALNIAHFCEKVNSMINYREGLGQYLKDKMKMLAPNTSTLVGETLGARLVSHAGSLSNLAKYPASTVQILGAEKALFRALKARNGKTPKYGLLYYSQYIGKAATKNKGKISRYLANKIAQTTKLDFFSSNRESVYGEEFKKQVEERLNFLTTGEKPRKNVDVMKEASQKLELTLKENDEKEAKNKKKKDKKKDSNDDEVERKASISKKKEEKKAKKQDSDDEDSEEEERKRKQAKKDKKKKLSV